MNIQVLECPNCHASLENDSEEMGVFYCKYCGQKIVVAELQDAAYKVKVREMELEHDEKRMEFEQRKQNMVFAQEKERKAIQEKNDNKNVFMGLGIMFGSLLLGVLIMTGMTIPHKLRVHELKKVEAEVQSAIQAGDYDLALIKVNQLRLDDGYSTEQTESWDEKREDYIKLIKGRQEGGE